MEFVIDQKFLEKTFTKIGELSTQDLDLSGNNGVQFLSGFVDALHKEAGLTPGQIAGFLKFATEVGVEAYRQKNASEDIQERLTEIDDAFDEISAKLADGLDVKWYNPLTWGNPVIKAVTEAHGRASGAGAVDRLGKNIGNMFDKGMKAIQDPEFLGKIAPWAIGAIGGYLIPKMLGSQGNGLVNAAAGAALVGGGKMLADKYDLFNPEKWEKFKQQTFGRK